MINVKVLIFVFLDINKRSQAIFTNINSTENFMPVNRKRIKISTKKKLSI
jgi:hypothetical protein